MVLRASLPPRNRLGGSRARGRQPATAGVGKTRCRPHRRLGAKRNNNLAPPITRRWRTGPRWRRTGPRSRRTGPRWRQRLGASKSRLHPPWAPGLGRTSRRPQRRSGGWRIGLHPPVTLRRRRSRRCPPMTLGARRVSRWPRMLLSRCMVGRRPRSSPELPEIRPRCPGTGRRVWRTLPSRPSNSPSARIVRRHPPAGGREGMEPGAPPMGSLMRAPFHHLLTSGRWRTGLRPRPVGILLITVRAVSGRRLPGVNQGPSGPHPRRRRAGSGPTRRAWRQGRSGGPGRGPHRRRSHRRRSHRGRSCGLGVRRLRPHPPVLRDLSSVPSRRCRFRPILGDGGTYRGAGRAVRLDLPTHRGTAPHRGTSPPTHAPGSRPVGRRTTTAEHLHHERVKVPTRDPAEPSTRGPVKRR